MLSCSYSLDGRQWVVIQSDLRLFPGQRNILRSYVFSRWDKVREGHKGRQ